MLSVHVSMHAPSTHLNGAQLVFVPDGLTTKWSPSQVEDETHLPSLQRFPAAHWSSAVHTARHVVAPHR